MPLPALQPPSMRIVSMPLRASWAATIVPENPPPTIATGFCRSDFIVGPFLGVARATVALLHHAVKPDDCSSGGLREPGRYSRMDDAGGAGANQLGPDPDRASAMTNPSHPEGTRVVGEDVSGPCLML